MSADPEAPRTRLATALGAVALVVVLVAFCAEGLRGLDFGRHWDEPRLLDSARRSAATGNLLPGWYNYPSLAHLLATAATRLHGALAGSDPSVAELDRGALLLAVRRWFFLTSLPAVAATVAAARLAGCAWRHASVAGLVVASSFPLFYHARWIAPDVPLCSAGALTLAAGLWALGGAHPGRLVVAGMAAGLGLGAKYPGGLLLLIPLVAANRPSRSGRRTALVLAVATATFLAVTPGALLDGARFVADVRYEVHHYAERGHGIFTIAPGPAHLGAMLQFLALRAGPGTGIGAAAVSSAVLAAALAGAGVAWRRGAATFGVLCLVPLTYVLYFSLQRVMVVRNLLVLLPFLGVLAALALARACKRWPSAWTEGGGVLLALALATPAVATYRATTASLDGSVRDDAASVTAFVAARSDRAVAVSRGTVERLGATRFGVPGKAALDPHGTAGPPSGAPEVLLFLLGEFEIPRPLTLEPPYLGEFANRPGVYLVVAGADEIDLDYYPSWSGRERVVAVEGWRAARLASLHPERVALSLPPRSTPR